MKKRKRFMGYVTVILSLACLLVLAGNVYAMPFKPAVNYVVGTYPTSVAAGDFNGDDDLDLAVANYLSNNVSILLGNGDGTFAAAVNYAVGTGPRSVAVGDFDGDGDLDLAVANSNSNNVSILLGNGDGTFASAVNYAAGSWPSSIAVGDFDGDGDPDLAVANFSRNNISILMNNGNGTFATAMNYAAGTSPYSVAVGDFDGDGDLDLAVANTNSHNISILLNNGNGTFALAVNNTVGTKPTSVAVGDFDGDGDLDLAVANSNSNNVSRLLGNGNGNFPAVVNYAVGSSPRFITVGDYDGDGNPDLAVANSNNVSILLNNGNGTFATAANHVVGTGPRSVAVGDFNGDGHPDLAVANDSSNNVSILLNTAPPPPTLLTPLDGINSFGNMIGFSWQAAPGANKYQLQIRRTSNNTIFRNLFLGDVTRKAVGGFPANATEFRWRVRSGNVNGWGAWSVYRQFKNPFGTFNHNFNTTNGYLGWIRTPETSWDLNARAMLTAGQANRFVSARRGSVYYRNLDYSVRMQRKNSNLGEQYLVIRAGTKYEANGLWHPGYGFGYRNNGTYRVIKLNNNGTITTLRNWTASTHIKKNGWNILRVRAVNNNLRFFINGNQVWSGNNSAFARGMVGVMMFRRGTDPASTRLLVDWVRLSNPAASAAYEDEILLQEILEEEVFEEDALEILEELLDEEDYPEEISEE